MSCHCVADEPHPPPRRYVDRKQVLTFVLCVLGHSVILALSMYWLKVLCSALGGGGTALSRRLGGGAPGASDAPVGRHVLQGKVRNSKVRKKYQTTQLPKSMNCFRATIFDGKYRF